MLDGGEYSPAVAEPCFTTCSMNHELTTNKKKKNKNKRRFSDEQIKSLEVMFESESRLEPRKKLQLARELQLQPRQVAIWFQNKRARWKSKQLEREYSVLRANYNNLASRFETVKKEKQALMIQLQKLNEFMQKTEDDQGSKCCKEGGGIDRESETRADTNRFKSEVKPNLSVERSEHGLGVLSNDDSGIKTEYFEVLEEEPNLMSMVEPADSSLTSTEDWGNIESDGLFDQASSSYEWWDFWS